MKTVKDFDNYVIEKFDDIRILRYKVPAFEALTLKEKLFVYYLSQAAQVGRDILWDQNNKYNLKLRTALVKILKEYRGDRDCDEFEAFENYCKHVFFANGIHHHYSMDKFAPSFTISYFRNLLEDVGDVRLFLDLKAIVFDSQFMSKRVVLGGTSDLVSASANNFYSGVTQVEAEAFYGEKDNSKVSWGLNSTLVKDENGDLREDVWKIGGKYSKIIAGIVFFLKKAIAYADNNKQVEALNLLIDFYRTGNLETFDKFSIAWVEEHESNVDFINGFIEVYGDPLGRKGSWESVVEIVDKEACHRTDVLCANAEWFERNSPTNKKYKKTKVKGVSARVMQVAMLGGDSYPATPIGINLPNAEWIREEYGSKSVTLDNITYAYDQANAGSGSLEEFAASPQEIDLCKKYSYLGGCLHTDLHECLGHGSGKLCDGVSQDALKNYASTIEEARADLFALYFIMDAKMVDLGLMPSLDVAKAEYCDYVRNALLVQMARIKDGCDLEESHMRNRQLIVAWAYEKGLDKMVIEKVVKNGKTYFLINDFEQLRSLFGDLLCEVQRIKSEGDYEAAKQLVETYGVKLDRQLHKEVVSRYKALGIAPYSGFVNPVYSLKYKGGVVSDVLLEYPDVSYLSVELENL